MSGPQGPIEPSVAAVRARVSGAEDVEGGFLVRDPWDIAVAIVEAGA